MSNKKLYEVRFVEVINRKNRRYVFASCEDEAVELCMSGYGERFDGDYDDEVVDDEDWEVFLIDE